MQSTDLTKTIKKCYKCRKDTVHIGGLCMDAEHNSDRPVEKSAKPQDIITLDAARISVKVECILLDVFPDLPEGRLTKVVRRVKSVMQEEIRHLREEVKNERSV